METNITVYLVCLAILVVITLGISIRAFLHWQRPGARTLGFLMLAMSIWAGFYWLEIVSPSLPEKIFARKMLYLGMSASPPLWLIFALRYTGTELRWLKKKRTFLLALPALVSFFMGLTNDLHHLIWKSLTLPLQEPAPLLIESGPVFWIFTAIAFTLILAGIFTYFISHYHSTHYFRVKTGLILAGVMLTAIVNLSFLLSDKTLTIDPTPLSFMLSAPLIAFGFFRFGVTNLFPLAAPLIIDNMRDAIVVVDQNNEITDLNPAAKELLKVHSLNQKIPAFNVLPFSDEFKKIWDIPNASLKLELVEGENTNWYEAKITTIPQKNQTLIGRMIIFHNTTREQSLLRAEELRSQQLKLLEETGRLIADSLIEQEIHQRAVKTIIEKFGYASTIISLLTPNNVLEIAAIAGAEYPGYDAGYKQPMGAGIIGHTASIRQTYVSNSLAEDSYYYSTLEYFGSAVCTPLWKQGELFGVLYVESKETNAFDEIDIKTIEALAAQVSASLYRASLYHQTQESLRTLSTIQEISKAIGSSLDLETIGQTVVNRLKDSFGYTHVSIYTLENDHLRLAAQVDYPTEIILYELKINQGVMGRAVRTKSVQFVEDASNEESFIRTDPQITNEICIPLMKEDIVLGTLNVEAGDNNKLSRSDVEVLTTIAGPLALAIDNARLHAQIKKMATTDAVTGLYNRHVFEHALNAEMERAQRKNAQVSLVIFDIDAFKEYNDTWGHPAGDGRLREVAEIIRDNLRKYDVAARYGGDEFAIILSDCSQENALLFAKRLHQATKSGAPTPSHNDADAPGYTLSMGVATYPLDAETPLGLLIAADHAALRAKQQGKNRIKLASDYETH